jgi:hypothetical protein
MLRMGANGGRKARRLEAEGEDQKLTHSELSTPPVKGSNCFS